MYHEFVRADRQGSRAIMNDIFMMSVWHEDQDIIEIILTQVELNITIRGLNLEQLQDLDDIRGFVFNMGEIIAFDPPRLIENGSYAVTVRLTMNVFHTLRENTIEDDGRGGLNTLTFEYHDLPHNLCEFCHRLGHKQKDYGQYIQAQNITHHGYKLPAPPALYPPLHPPDDDIEDFMGDADDEFGFLADDNDVSNTNSSNNSASTYQTEISIHDHDDAISPVTSEELLVKIKKHNSPPFVVNPHQLDEFGFNTPEPFFNPNPYEITWEPKYNISTKRPNPSHYLYNFHHEELKVSNHQDVYPPATSDPATALSSTAHLWPTFEDYRNWITSELDPKRGKQYKELAVKNPAILVDIYQAASTTSPDSPLVRPESVPMDIWISFGYQEIASTSQVASTEEEREQTFADRKGK
ncbi:hypothetical protein MKW92_000806 [Papaver armeniacum]|nr:hypothetical protein MKW92_000806 [Papaver armeniacum]